MLRRNAARAATAGPIALLFLSLAPVPALAGAECVWGSCVNGEGTMRYPDGRMESGTWRDGVLVRPRLKIQDDRLASRQPGHCVRGNCMNGEGKWEYPDGSLYEGSFSASQRDGEGVLTWPNHARYEGGWMADKRHGHGVLTDRFGGRYDGQWRDDARTRSGVYVGVDGSKYQGDYLGDLRHGYGVLTGVKGDRYVGEFRAGEIHGVGTWTGADGRVLEGHWSRGRFERDFSERERQERVSRAVLSASGGSCMFGDCVSGRGTYAWTDGRMYTGAFDRARPHGRGSLQFPDGRVESGTWDQGKRIGRRVIAAPSAVARWRKQAAPPTGCTAGQCGGGQGTFRWGDGSSYTGSFRRGQPHGQGTWIHPSGRAYAGGWKDGRRHGPGSETHSTGETLRGIWYEGRLTESASANPGPAAARTARTLGAAPAETLAWPDLSRSARVLGGGERDAAVVVGIESYAHVAPVPGARENAAAWYEWLVRTRRVPLERVSLLVDQDATREEIRFAVAEAAEQVERRGTLWFVFIGHGAPARSGRDGLLVGYDAQQKARSLETRSLERSDLLERLAEGPAAQIQVFLDACFSGRGPGGEALVAGLQPLVVMSAMVGADERTNVFTAARNDEYAGPLPGARRPAFSYLALGGLRGWADRDGDGRVRAAELHHYVGRALRILVRGRRQRSTLWGSPDSVVAQSLGEQGPDLSSFVVGRAKSGGTR